MTQGTFSKVIVVGAGPAGLLLALMLGQQGVNVQVLELNDFLDNRPRATHYGIPAVHELNRAGVGKDMAEAGFFPKRFCWRKLDGTYLAGLNCDDVKDLPDRLLCLPLDKTSRVIYDHLVKLPNVELSWKHKVTGLGQNDDKAWVTVETPEGTKTLEADYIVGCDGANSQIRRSLFGDMEFPGKTWDEQVVATNVYYDFDKFGYYDSNFIIHPEHWYMAARISKDGLWRVSYGELTGFTPEELVKRQPMKFEKMLPGHPKPDEYKLVSIGPYRVHQRLAKSMRVGRFLLAADAAHLCNPFGGLGLTGGIVDVGNLYDCLIGIYRGVADPSILDKYSEIRRQKYSEVVDPISSANIRRMFEADPETVLETDVPMQMCLKAEKEKDIELARKIHLSAMDLQYDFTQFYKPVAA